METEVREDMKIGIGNEEMPTLQPKNVLVESVAVQEVGPKKAHKVVCSCKHPDKAEQISISSCKYEKAGKLDVAGLWVNKDNAGMIRKGSALAVFMQTVGAKTVSDLAGKSVMTMLDDKGYLTFKCY